MMKRQSKIVKEKDHCCVLLNLSKGTPDQQARAINFELLTPRPVLKHTQTHTYMRILIGPEEILIKTMIHTYR